MDDPRLAPLGQFTPEGFLTPGYGDGYLFSVGRDDVHGILLYLLRRETYGFPSNQFGYADDEINAAIVDLMRKPSVMTQMTLDQSQFASVKHEHKMVLADLALDPVAFANAFAISPTATGDISHTKGGICIGQGIWYEGSTNLSAAGEGIGISLKADVANPKGFHAQSNTLYVSTNPVALTRFHARLNAEHAYAKAHMEKSGLLAKMLAEAGIDPQTLSTNPPAAVVDALADAGEHGAIAGPKAVTA